MSLQAINHTYLWDFSESLLNDGCKAKVKAGGNSMYPFIKRGSYVVIEKTDFHKIRKGDVVVFKGHKKVVAHRVISIKRNTDNWLLICKGDSSNRADVPFSAEKYIGKVTAVESHNKMRQIDTPFYCVANRIIAFLSPFLPFIYNTLRFFKHLFTNKEKTKQHL